jgi:hypothetical protein
MAGTTDVWAGNALDFLTGRATALVAPRTTYLALCIADPGNAATMATLPEISTAGYARQQVVWTAPSGAPMTTMNNALLFFGPFTAAMTDAAAYGALVSTASGTSGDVIFAWPIPNPLLAAVNESLQIAAGALTLNS